MNRLSNVTFVLKLLNQNMNNKQNYYIKSRRLVTIIKIKLFMYYSLLFILIMAFFCYNSIFCIVYSSSQWNWFMNGIISVGISLITLLSSSVAITLLRYIGLMCKSETIFNMSLYLNK